MGMTRFYRIGNQYIGGFSDGAIPPNEAIECSEPPHGFAVWDNGVWIWTEDNSPEIEPIQPETTE
jgi:hypothetical protein